MNKLFTFLSVVLLTASVLAQSPQKMSYQAVIRNSRDALVTNTMAGMQISILLGLASGTVVYTETQTPTTNTNGLVTIEIGGGTGFNTIDWSNGPYFIKTETDPAGGTNYNITGTSQLLSVLYALHAKTLESVTKTDPVFSAWDKSTGISITESQISDLGSYIETEIQTLTDIIIKNNSANRQIKNLTDPTDEKDAATKAYVDSLLARIESLELLNYGFTDARDNNHYNTVKIGNQIWMAENLKYLPSVVSPATGSQTDPYYYVYGYDGTDVNAVKATANYNTYGVLYNWPAAMNSTSSSNTNPSRMQGVCPTGWHLPSDAEWTELTDYLGGTSVAGGKLKETGTTHWTDPNTGASNETGFTALPGGYRHGGGAFDNIGHDGLWWCATEYDTNGAWGRNMDYDDNNVVRDNGDEELGFSVRCVRD